VDERTGELRTANEQLQNTTDELRGVNDKLLSEIVEREQADQRLRELYEEERGLRQQLEVEFNKRVQFARTLAHELKTPLTSVLASSDLLISQLSEEPLLGLAQNINRSAANLDSRIGELLDLARGEIGMLEMKLESLDILQLLRDAGSEMAAVAASQGQSLVLDLPSSLPLVNADAARVNQIVANLLTNAFKFTPEGGKIALRSRESGSSVVVEVQDTGPGISKSDQERLFEPYHRVARDRDRFSGLGLGLALAKTLVELHGGEIWVRSHPGQGSTFGFSLPLESVTQQARPSDKDSRLWKVLIIEDDQEIVKSMDLAFQILWPEAELVPARCGEVGIDKVETEDPDLVILDLGLPDISGFDVLRRIRLFSRVPIIVMTVRTGEEDVVKALEWGADDYVTKPFKQKELLARLQAQLRKQPCHDGDMPVVCGTLRFDPSTSQVSYGGREVSLTIIEGQVLQCLMRNAGNVVAHSRIAEVVWGDEYPGAVESLRTHIWRLREKLEDDPGNPQLIRTKAGIGYSLAKPR
ncbi:MAG: ATP-binding protein, partial [Dehalococcoidia bacterium]